VPDTSSAVILTIEGSSYHAFNARGTGICFRWKRYPPGKKCTGIMRLPGLDKIFPVNLEVVTVPKDFCRCHFADIHPAAENLLHIYILELQKEKIREILLP
jgi:hypothetical protein